MASNLISESRKAVVWRYTEARIAEIGKRYPLVRSR